MKLSSETWNAFLVKCLSSVSLSWMSSCMNDKRLHMSTLDHMRKLSAHTGYCTRGLHSRWRIIIKKITTKKQKPKPKTKKTEQLRLFVSLLYFLAFLLTSPHFFCFSFREAEPWHTQIRKRAAALAVALLFLFGCSPKKQNGRCCGQLTNVIMRKDEELLYVCNIVNIWLYLFIPCSCCRCCCC